MKTEYINYPKIIDESMHIAVRNVLSIVERDGIQGDHQFFVTFATSFHGVHLSKIVSAKYPEEITIVIQHQFEQLVVGDEYFSIGLTFNGVFEIVVVPYKAIKSFTDSGAKFSIQFSYFLENSEETSMNTKEEMQDIPDKENVIVLDKFRKKKK